MLRRSFSAAMLAVSSGSMMAPAEAVIIMREGPPTAREEIIPAARPGHVWSNGHWQWHNSGHRWIAGRWIPTRPGYLYSQPEWIERDGRSSLQRGTWRRADRDGDDMPNRMDRAPDNPLRF